MMRVGEVRLIGTAEFLVQMQRSLERLRSIDSEMHNEITGNRLYFMEQIYGTRYHWPMNRRFLMYAAFCDAGDETVIGAAVLAVCHLREMVKAGRVRWRLSLEPRAMALRRALGWSRANELGEYFNDYLESCLRDIDEVRSVAK